MDVSDVGTEVADGIFRSLIVHTEGIMQIPERSQIVADKALEEGAEFGGIGKDTDSFDQQSGSVFLCGRQSGTQKLLHQFDRIFSS